jgi:hypothetical protein
LQGGKILFEGGYRNREKITVPNKGYGVVIKPEPIYEYPKDHPCHGCVFTLQANVPSCMTGNYPDTENCINAFYKKMQARWRAERENELADENKT